MKKTKLLPLVLITYALAGCRSAKYMNENSLGCSQIHLDLSQRHWVFSAPEAEMMASITYNMDSLRHHESHSASSVTVSRRGFGRTTGHSRGS